MHTKSIKQSLQLFVTLLLLLLANTGNVWGQIIEVENVIDVTDTYITNASFETGDMTGWTEKCYNGSAQDGRPVGDETGISSVRNIGDDLSSSDGEKMYEMFAWRDVTWNSFYEIHQALPYNLPAGTYTLTCVVSTMGAKKTVSLFTGTDQTFGLTYDMYATNDEFITTGDTGDAEYKKGHLLSVTFTWNGYDGEHPLYVGAGIVVYQWSWVIALKVDNFRLYQHKTVTSTNYLANPSFDVNGPMNAANTPNPHISEWTPSRASDKSSVTIYTGLISNYTVTPKDQIYFAVVDATHNGGTSDEIRGNGSRMNGNSGCATPLHGDKCALIRMGNNEATHYFAGNSSSQNDAWSNGSGTLTATASGLQPGTYNCKLYYKLVHVGNASPYVELKVTPQTGRGSESSSQGGGSINTGLVSKNSTDYRLNGNWNDFGWRELSTTFTITGNGTATASIAVKMRAENTSGASADDYLISDNYAYDTEALIDHIIFTKIASPIDLSSGDYYFENQETGQWLSAGATWGTHATTDATGMPVTLSQGTYPGFYNLRTQFTDGGSGYVTDKFFCDGTADDYQFQESTANPGEYYIITPGGQLLYATGTSTDYVEAEAKGRNINTTATTNPPNSTRWKMYTRAQRITNLKNLVADPAHPDEPVADNATFLIDNANFDRNRDHSKWTNWANAGFGGEESNMNIEHFNKNFDFYQTLSDLPRGHYALRVQGYYRPGGNTNVSTDDYAQIYANPGTAETALLPLIASEGREYSLGAFDTENTQSGAIVYVPNNQPNASKAFSGGYYDHAILTFSTTADNQSTKVGVKKTTTIDQDWTVIDNFRLYYSPLSEEEALEEALKDVKIPEGQMNHDVYHEADLALQSYEVVKERDGSGNLTHTKAEILAAYDAVSIKIAAAKTSIDEYIIINNYLTALQGTSQLGDVDPVSIAANEVVTKYSDGVYYPVGKSGTTGTYVTHTEVIPLYKQFVRNYWDENLLEEGTDLTSFIVNQGFEFGNTDEWTHGNSYDTGVRPTSDPTYVTTGSEGNWLFNTWWTGVPITQTVTDLPNGKYTFKVKVASSNSDADAKLFVLLNSAHSDVITITRGNSGTFYEQTYEVEVTDGNFTMGVVGGNDAGDYVEDGYWWYKADNFRLILKELYVTPDTYYFYNESTGQYLSTHGGADYGTQVMLDDVGLDVALAANRSIDTRVYPSAAAANNQTGDHHLYVNGSNVPYLDGPSTNIWKFAKCGTTYYLRMGTKYLASNGSNTAAVMVDSKTDAAKWQMKTRADRIAELESMNPGDADVDATFLVPGNDFTRGDRRVFDNWTMVNNSNAQGFAVYSATTNNYEAERWSGTESLMVYEVGGSPRFRRGGRDDNFTFEAYHNKYDASQTLTDIPNGVYTITAQCFDGENGTASELYAESDVHVDLTSLGAPLDRTITIDWKQEFPKNISSGLDFCNGTLSAAMTNATVARSSGLKIKVVNGTMKLGFRNTGEDQWSVLDNLRMTYRPFVESDVQEEITPDQAWLDDMVNVDRETPYDDDAFKIPNDETHRLILQMAVENADSKKTGTEVDMTDGLFYLLPAAKEIIENTDPADFAVNDPGTSAKFNVVGQNFSNAKLTVKANKGAVDSGNDNPVKLRFDGTTNEDHNYPQAFTFEKVAGVINGFRIRYDIGDETRYLCTGEEVGSTVGWKKAQIRSTTDGSKALTFRVIALTTADDTWYLRNVETNELLGNNNEDFYTGNQNYDVGFVPAVMAQEVNVSIQKKYQYSTLILPFDVPTSELSGTDIKVYAPSRLDGNVVEIDEVNHIEANVPYIIYTPLSDTSGSVDATFQNYGKGYYDNVLDDEKGLYGTFKAAGVSVVGSPSDSPRKYVLSAKTVDGVIRTGFYRLTTTRTMAANRCYFVPAELPAVVPDTPVKEEVYYFKFFDNPDAIDELFPLGNVEVLGTYDATGKKLPSLQKGLNILKMADGTTRKIMVK